MRSLAVLTIIAASFFFVMFSPWTAPLVNFWVVMSISASTLSISALLIQRKKLKQLFHFKGVYIPLGIISAVVLYFVFFFGKHISQFILPFAGDQITGIYHTQESAPLWLIGVLLLLLIGPAEEIFWRGFVQQKLSDRFNPNIGFAAASAIYALVHIWSFNFMLIAAAAVAGVFWGYIYKKTNALIPVIISHALWDVLIFVIFPLN